MVCGTFTYAKVPKDELDASMALLKANDPPPTSVSSKDNGDGTFTVTAVFPKCPDGTAHSTDGA